MNLTLSLLAGLVLLLPGITALASWNLLGNNRQVRRPDLPLTAVNALVIAVGVSILVQVVFFVLAELVAAPAEEQIVALIRENLNGSDFNVPDPFLAAFGLATDATPNVSAAAFATFLAVVLLECLFVALVINSRGLEIILDGIDARSFGWAHEHIWRPLSHGYTPTAFVLTSALHEGRGIGYQGSIIDIRLDDLGQVKSLSLGQPERFVYDLTKRAEAETRGWGPFAKTSDAREPKFETSENYWIGGVLVIDPSTIQQIWVHSLSDSALDELNDLNQARKAST